MAITVNGPNGVSVQFPDGTDDDTINKVMTEATGGAQPSAEPQRGRAMLNGLTFGLGPRVMAAGRSLTSEETYSDALKDEYKKLDDYRKAEPWSAAGYEIAGSVPSMLIPGVNAIGNASRIKTAAQAVTNPALRTAATQAGVRSLGHEVGRGAAQIGALQAGLHSKDYTDVANVAENTAVGGAIGYAGGRVLNAVAQPLISAGALANEARSVGGNTRVAALQQLRESVNEQGTDLATAAKSFLPQSSVVGEDAQRAILSAYHDAVGSGTPPAQAKRLAEAAYLRLNPTNAKGGPIGRTTLTNHVNQVVDEFSASNRTPLMAAEVLSGADQPIVGEMKSLTQGIMNSPGEGRTILGKAVKDRQDGAIERTRELIDRSIGANIPGGGRDYVGGIKAIEEAASDARNQAYAAAKARARGFDIEPVLQRWRDIADLNAGAPRDEVLNAVGTMQDWFTRMAEKLKKNLSPSQRGTDENQILLNSYRQTRSALGDKIGQLRKDGDREAAALLIKMRNEMDDVVRRRNPLWWRANNNTAESFRILEAADRGRTLPLREGAPMQELAYDMTNQMTAAEREAARLGVARKIHDELSNLPDGNDVSRPFMRGGSDQADEGMRGLIERLMTGARDDARSRAMSEAAARGVSARAQTTAGNKARNAIPTADEFYSQIKREQIAKATFGLDKGSQTNALQAADKKRNIVLQAAMNIMHNPNPLQALPLLARMAAERAGRARDAELAKMLSTSTNRPDQLLRLLDELLRTAPGTKATMVPKVSEGAAIGSVASGGELADWAKRKRAR